MTTICGPKTKRFLDKICFFIFKLHNLKTKALKNKSFETFT